MYEFSDRNRGLSAKRNLSKLQRGSSDLPFIEDAALLHFFFFEANTQPNNFVNKLMKITTTTAREYLRHSHVSAHTQPPRHWKLRTDQRDKGNVRPGEAHHNTTGSTSELLTCITSPRERSFDSTASTSTLLNLHLLRASAEIGLVAHSACCRAGIQRKLIFGIIFCSRTLPPTLPFPLRLASQERPTMWPWYGLSGLPTATPLAAQLTRAQLVSFRAHDRY